MEERLLECLMMLQIHRYDTPNIDAVIDQFATTSAHRFDFLIHVSVYTVVLQYNRQT